MVCLNINLKEDFIPYHKNFNNWSVKEYEFKSFKESKIPKKRTTY